MALVLSRVPFLLFLILFRSCLSQPHSDESDEQATREQQTSPPHIIIVLADCLGWSDVSFHGRGQIPTPNLDTLALNGVAFKQLYTQPSSSAARGSLLTGKYAHKLGLQDMFLVAGIPAGLPLKHKLLPEYLNDLGYETHLIGKWHLGYQSTAYLPTSRGFHSAYGNYLDRLHYYKHIYDEEFWSNSTPGYDFHQNGFPFRKAQGHHITGLLTARTDMILKSRQKPLFLLLSHVAPGGSEFDWAVKEEERYRAQIRHIEHEKRSSYAAVIHSLDVSIGRLMESLQSTGIVNNSVVMVMSATGGRSLFDQFQPVASSPWPLRGQRFSFFEGGIRSTGLIWSPLLRDRGYASDKLYHISDWLPTFLSLAGGSLDVVEDCDGYNIWDSLSQREEPSPRSRILHQLNPYQDNMFVARLGNFKVIHGGDSLSAYYDWYPPQGNEQDATQVDAFILSSRTYKVLSRLPGFVDISNGWRRDYSLFCSPEESVSPYIERIQGNSTSHCKPEKQACLFDVLTDPCELHNLANDMPHHIEVFKRWALKHLPEVEPLQMTVNRLNKFDPKADPIYHRGCWEPWQSQSDDRHDSE